jgi:hypothetical protein
MTPLNFAVPNWQLTIGDWDITHLVSQFTLKRPLAEISTPYSWQGSFVLDETLNPDLLAEPLDDLVNPQRWAIGIHPIRVKIENKLIATLRIKRYFYDEDNFAGAGELTDQLGLRDFESPPKDFEGIGFQVSRAGLSVSAVVNRLLQMAGLVSSVSIPGTFQVPPNKFTESYISLAQQICGERGYWLYCDTDEIIKAVAYRPREVVSQYSRSQVQLFERQPGLEIPAEIFRVSGSCEKIATCGSEDPIINEEFEPSTDGKSKILIRRETIYPFTGNSRQIVVEQSLSSLFPDKYPGNTSTIISERTTEKVTYDSKGRLKKSEKLTSKLLGAALPDDYPGDRTMISNAEVITEEYSNSRPNTARIGNDDGVLRGKVTTKTILFRSDVNTGTPLNSIVPIWVKNYERAIKEQTIESWDENTNSYGVIVGGNNDPKCRRMTYKQINYLRNRVEVNVKVGDGGFSYVKLGELVVKSTIRKTNQQPTDWTTKEPENPVDTVTIKGESRFYPVSFSPYYEKEFETSASTLTTDNECQKLANLIGTLQHQRYRSRLITIPPSDIEEWLNNTTPFSTHNIHNGAFVMDSPAIVLNESSMVFSFIGNYLGAIPLIIEPSTIPEQPISPIIQTLPIQNSYEYLINVQEGFNNTLSAIISSYNYSVDLNISTVLSDYQYEVEIV